MLQLRNGQYTEVDEIDYYFSSQWIWNVYHNPRSNMLLARRCGTRKEGTILLHKEIAERMGLNIIGAIDHKDRNSLNNCRYNLRETNMSLNTANSSISISNTSGFKGVRFRPDKNKWISRICVDYKTIHLGYFDNPIDAALAYDQAAREHFGEFANPNFPLKESKV